MEEKGDILEINFKFVQGQDIGNIVDLLCLQK